jgi:single-strand DNA-binding protein
MDKKSMELTETAEWHKLFFRENLGKVVSIMEKGQKLYIEGKLKYNKYTASDGSNRYSTDIIVLNIIFLTPKKNGAQDTSDIKSPSYDDVTESPHGPEWR